MAKPRIGYWNIRGYAQPIRLLLAYTGTDFEDVRYNYIPVGDGTWDRSEWTNVKPTLGLDFPNIPYYIDDDVRLTQTFAILRYLGRKHGLAPITDAEKIRVDLIEAEINDMRANWGYFCYGATDFESGKQQYLANFNAKLKDVSKFLGNHQFFAGTRITYVDFYLYEILDANSCLEPTVLADFPSLKNFHARIQALPAVAAYIKSDKFLPKPFNGAMAIWGGN